MTLASKAASLILFGCLGVAPSAFASLIPSNPFEVDMTGTGFGNVATIITVQTANAQSTTEAGCIGYNNTTTGCGITQVGQIKNTSQLEPVPTGVTDASQLRFFFNATQPDGSSITLNQLQVSFYGTSSTPLYTATLANAPLTLTRTLPGVGQTGYEFQLDRTEVAEVNKILSQTTSIGGGISASTAYGGPDTLFVGSGPTATPEPSTYALLGSGLTVLALIKRRRK